MPDIFDKLASEESASQVGDIFDKLANEEANKPKGDSLGFQAYDTLARAGMGAYDAMKWFPGVSQIANAYPGKLNSGDASADAISQMQNNNANLGQQVVKGTAQGLSTLPQILPFVKAAGAIPMVGKAMGGAFNPIVGMAGYGATTSGVQGQNPVQGAAQGAAQGLAYSAGGALGSKVAQGVMNPLAMKIGGNLGGSIARTAPAVGSSIGMAGAGSLTAPEGQKTSNAIVGGALGALSPIGKESYDDIVQNHADAYRDILNPGKGVLQKVEIKSKKDFNEAMKLAAQEGVIINKDTENKLDTTGAIAQLQPKITNIHNYLNQILDSDKHKQFDLESLRATAKDNLSRSIKNAEDLDSAHAQVDSAIDAEISRNNNSPFVTGSKLNNIKQGLWSKSYDLLSPNSNKTSRQIGNVAKDMIEQGYQGQDIKGLNQSMGSYLDLQNILSTSHGNIVQAGKLGQHFGRLTGLGVGGLVGHALPFPGSEAIGAVAGQEIGSKIPAWMNDPTRLTTNMANKIKVSQLANGINTTPNFNPIPMTQQPIYGLPSPQAPLPPYLQARQNIPSMNIPRGSAVSSNPIPMAKGTRSDSARYNPNAPKGSVFDVRPEGNPITEQALKNPVTQKGLPKGVKALGLAGALTAGSMFNPLNSQASQQDQQRLQLPSDQYTKQEEGFRANPYIDTKGNKTIGYGFKMDAVGKYLPDLVREGRRPLSKQEADKLFTKLYSNARSIAENFAGDNWHNLNGQQQKVLSDMAYNMGGKLNRFKKLRRAINDGDYHTASQEILNSDYAKQAPNRAKRNSTLILGT